MMEKDKENTQEKINEPENLEEINEDNFNEKNIKVKEEDIEENQEVKEEDVEETEEEKLKEEIKRLKEEKIRVLAEMENLRKRFDREKIEVRVFQDHECQRSLKSALKL